MRYTLLLYYPEPTADELGPEALAEGMRAFDAYAKALTDAGVLANAEVFFQQSNMTTTVTLAGESSSSRTARSPTRRSNSAARSSSMFRISTPRSSGRGRHHRCHGVTSRSDQPRPATWTAHGRECSRSR